MHFFQPVFMAAAVGKRRCVGFPVARDNVECFRQLDRAFAGGVEIGRQAVDCGIVDGQADFGGVPDDGFREGVGGNVVTVVVPDGMIPRHDAQGDFVRSRGNLIVFHGLFLSAPPVRGFSLSGDCSSDNVILPYYYLYCNPYL